MNSLKGTGTEKNLLTAFAGETQARNRYTYFAGRRARKAYPDRRHLRGDGEPGEGARQALLQVPRGRGRGDHGRLSGRQDRHHRRKPEGRGHGASMRSIPMLYPGFAKIAQEEGFAADRSRLEGHLRRREAAREALPRPARQHRERPGLQAGAGRRLALPQLRLPPRGARGAPAPARPAPIPRPTSNCWARTGRAVHLFLDNNREYELRK